jgi:hypothetical protein
MLTSKADCRITARVPVSVRWLIRRHAGKPKATAPLCWPYAAGELSTRVTHQQANKRMLANAGLPANAALPSTEAVVRQVATTDISTRAL